MQVSSTKRAKRILPVVFLFFILGCSSSPKGKNAESFSSYLIRDDGSPKTVAILPFRNETSKRRLGVLVRKSFYNHFSSKNYRDIELSKIDGILEGISEASSLSWENLSPSQLGEIFRADFLIYGKIKGFDKIFLGIYSQIALNLEVKMVECRRGQVVWSKAPDYKSHDGGVPTTLIGIIPAAIRSGYHLRDEEVYELIERTNREMVAEIPNPPNPAIATVLIEIQLASFSEISRALETAKLFKKKGFKARIVTAVIDGNKWHRIIIGPYFNKSEAEKAKEEISRFSRFQPIFIYRSLGEMDEAVKN